MSFQIDRGLFKLDFIDNHAILGVSVDAEIKDIRKRYLKVARRLHPDSFVGDSEQHKQQASQLLSKLVNPAWEKLSQERDRSEYLVLLKLKGQSAARQQDTLEILSNLARQIFTAPNPDHFYLTSLQELSEKQFEDLAHTLELTAQISELNLVYLMRKEGKGDPIKSNQSKIYTSSTATANQASNPAAAAPPPQARPLSVADQYYRRAEEFMAKNNFAKAILELRDALQIEPNNSRCHSLMGMIYLKQNQATMAKIHFNKALQLNPQDPIALEGKQKLEQPAPAANPKGGAAKPSAANPKAGSKPPDKPKGGGLFGGMFGGKKK